MDVVNVLNSVMWVLGNLSLAYTSIALLAYLITYFIVFDPRATTGGKLIFQFMTSLVSVLALVFIGVYVDPPGDRSWFEVPSNIEVWRPALRLIVYGFVAYSVTSLAWLLVMRKWFPKRLKKASDIILIEPRRTTGDITIVKSHEGDFDASTS